jgi:hypothetical protein
MALGEYILLKDIYSYGAGGSGMGILRLSKDERYNTLLASQYIYRNVISVDIPCAYTLSSSGNIIASYRADTSYAYAVGGAISPNLIHDNTIFVYLDSWLADNGDYITERALSICNEDRDCSYLRDGTKSVTLGTAINYNRLWASAYDSVYTPYYDYQIKDQDLQVDTGLKQIGSLGDIITIPTLNNFIAVTDTTNHCLKFYRFNDPTNPSLPYTYLSSYIGVYGSIGVGIGNFNTPRRLIYDSKNDFLYVLDVSNKRIVKLKITLDVNNNPVVYNYGNVVLSSEYSVVDMCYNEGVFYVLCKDSVPESYLVAYTELGEIIESINITTAYGTSSSYLLDYFNTVTNIGETIYIGGSRYISPYRRSTILAVTGVNYTAVEGHLSDDAIIPHISSFSVSIPFDIINIPDIYMIKPLNLSLALVTAGYNYKIESKLTFYDSSFGLQLQGYTLYAIPITLDLEVLGGINTLSTDITLQISSESLGTIVNIDDIWELFGICLLGIKSQLVDSEVFSKYDFSIYGIAGHFISEGHLEFISDTDYYDTTDFNIYAFLLSEGILYCHLKTFSNTFSIHGTLNKKIEYDSIECYLEINIDSSMLTSSPMYANNTFIVNTIQGYGYNSSIGKVSSVNIPFKLLISTKEYFDSKSSKLKIPFIITSKIIPSAYYNFKSVPITLDIYAFMYTSLIDSSADSYEESLDMEVKVVCI